MMENSIEILTERLKRKTEEFDQFIYIVSHDIKAPVRAINNLVSWIEDELEPENHSVNDYFTLLKNRVMRIESMMDALTEMSRIKRLDLEISETDVRKLINNTLDIIPFKKNIKTVIGEMPVFRTYEKKLFKVFSILLENAFRFHDKENGTICINCHDKGDNFEFELTDDGPGIHEDYHQKIFTMFYTLSSKDVVETNGAGLTLAKNIIEFVNGKIWVQSSPGAGSSFFFTWPKTIINKLN